MESNRESLEERLARIKLKNAEIEKKHREAEEDRMKAMQDNAMVEIKSHPPKQHKYDHVDFVYDDEASRPGPETAAAAPAVASSSRKGGPPPDPSYNFLADSTRDGTASKPSRTTDQPPVQHQQFRKGETFRRNQSKGSFDNDGQGRNKPVQHSVKPPKNLETNWRNPDQEIDRSKTAPSYINNNNKDGGSSNPSMGRKLTGPFNLATTVATSSPTTPSPPPKVFAEAKLPEPKEPELVVEQRGNIQISVSKDGEIQSVKLTNRSAQPGTGRVGLPRAITKQQVAVPSIPIAFSTPPPTLLDKPPPPLPIYHQPVASVTPPTPLSLEPKKFSVQDRLAKFQVALGSTNP